MNIDTILIIIIIIYLIIKKVNKKNKETFAITDQIVEIVKDIYNTDMESIKKLSDITNTLQNNGLTIPGNLTIQGKFNYLPKGTIVAFNQTTAPSGWTLCDGTNGTPDLRGRFILGTGQGVNLTNRIINSIGGAETHTVTIEQMPQHNHNNTLNAGTHSHTATGMPSWDALYYNDGGCDPYWNGRSHSNNSSNSGNHSHTIPNQGGNQPHNNMPPFFILTYIMKL